MTELKDEVEVVDIDTVVPYTNNPKEHPDEQVDKIASSIKNFGWDQPIVVDADNEIIKGHGRYQAAQKLGLDEVPIIRQTELSDAEARAARIADNRTAESAWDDDLLATELDILEDEDVGLDMTALEDERIQGLLDEIEPDEQAIEEAFGELPDGGRDPIRQKTFTLAEEQVETVERALEKAKDMGEFPPGPNDNSNGNALARVCREFLEVQ